MWKSVQMSIKVRLQIIKDLIRLLDIVQLMKCKLLEVQIFFLSQACLLLAAKVWSFVAYLFKKQYRTVSFPPAMSCSWHSKYRMIYSFPQIQQYKAIKYDISPLSPISRHRLNMVRKKVRKYKIKTSHKKNIFPGSGARPGRDPDPLPPRRGGEANSQTWYTARFHTQGKTEFRFHTSCH